MSIVIIERLLQIHVSLSVKAFRLLLVVFTLAGFRAAASDTNTNTYATISVAKPLSDVKSAIHIYSVSGSRTNDPGIAILDSLFGGTNVMSYSTPFVNEVPGTNYRVAFMHCAWAFVGPDGKSHDPFHGEIVAMRNDSGGTKLELKTDIPLPSDADQAERQRRRALRILNQIAEIANAKP